MEKTIKFLKKHRFVLYLFIFSFLLRLIVITTVKTPIESDFKIMYDAALEIINNKSTYKDSTYFLTWGYQMGHVIYEALLLKIINSPVFLKIVNALITSLTTVMIYLLSKKMANEKIAKIVSVAYSIFLFPLLLNTVLTNQFLPILLILIGLYILLNINYEKKYAIKSIVIGLLIGISNILRSEGIVIIFSIFLYSVFLVLKKYNLKEIIISFFLISISYFLIFNLTSTILIKTDISSNGLKNMNPTWKFVLGFNYDTNGMYSEQDAGAYANSQEKSKEILKERLNDYKKIPVLFLKKSKILWFNSDPNWSLGYSKNIKLVKILTLINQIFIIIFDLLALSSIISLFKNKLCKEQVLISLILMVYFGVYLLIEVTPRYAYSLQVFIAVLAAIGLNSIVNYIKLKVKKL